MGVASRTVVQVGSLVCPGCRSDACAFRRAKYAASFLRRQRRVCHHRESLRFHALAVHRRYSAERRPGRDVVLLSCAPDAACLPDSCVSVFRRNPFGARRVKSAKGNAPPHPASRVKNRGCSRCRRIVRARAAPRVKAPGTRVSLCAFRRGGFVRRLQVFCVGLACCMPCGPQADLTLETHGDAEIEAAARAIF